MGDIRAAVTGQGGGARTLVSQGGCGGFAGPIITHQKGNREWKGMLGAGVEAGREARGVRKVIERGGRGTPSVYVLTKP